MSEVETKQESVAGTSVGAPLDAILESGAPAAGPAEAPSQELDSAPAPDSPDAAARDDEPLVPLQALHRERERRQKMDAKVRELEDELQRFNEQRWGLEQQPEAKPQQQQQQPDQQKEWEQRAFAYNQSYANFVAKHGKAKVEAIDAAMNSLPAPQRAHILALAAQGEGDAVERVHQYVQQLGLLEAGFKPASIKDVLSGKKPDAPKVEAPPPNPDLEARERAIHAAEKRAHFYAAQTEFVSQFGSSNYNRLDAAWDDVMKSHPAAEQIRKDCAATANPIATAAHILNRLGVWSPEQAAPPQRALPLMPSDLAAARSVTSRNGPAFSGPTPLNDIFKR